MYETASPCNGCMRWRYDEECPYMDKLDYNGCYHHDDESAGRSPKGIGRNGNTERSNQIEM